MYYVFEGAHNEASFVKDTGRLSDERKARAIELDYDPTPPKVEGKRVILKAKKATNEVWYEYEDIPPNDEIEQLRNDLDSAILELTMAIAMQGKEELLNV